MNKKNMLVLKYCELPHKVCYVCGEGQKNEKKTFKFALPVDIESKMIIQTIVIFTARRFSFKNKKAIVYANLISTDRQK